MIAAVGRGAALRAIERGDVVVREKDYVKGWDDGKRGISPG